MMELEELAKPFAIRIEGPVDAGEREGTIANNIIGELKKPYFYSVFILNGTNVAFNELKVEDLNNTYRYNAIRKYLKRYSNETQFIVITHKKRLAIRVIVSRLVGIRHF